ncbi:hypothetical protein HYH03_003607 [Edaphochlamys debaryana]|uniref:Uncharacterized protein n=1 Tax=Edaphochlamys debaryana TaxID=47281 RepID=A0A835Y963_9CHLO|nr:hypothetical protein HYH03_003607 [Edaphochlamys debaryana]|eukprot:KAG2498348.1 hypothetical protein HYH03_003607 [Edaphochlamys debaryana]
MAFTDSVERSLRFGQPFSGSGSFGEIRLVSLAAYGSSLDPMDASAERGEVLHVVRISAACRTGSAECALVEPVTDAWLGIQAEPVLAPEAKRGFSPCLGSLGTAPASANGIWLLGDAGSPPSLAQHLSGPLGWPDRERMNFGTAEPHDYAVWRVGARRPSDAVMEVAFEDADFNISEDLLESRGLLELTSPPRAVSLASPPTPRGHRTATKPMGRIAALVEDLAAGTCSPGESRALSLNEAEAEPAAPAACAGDGRSWRHLPARPHPHLLSTSDVLLRHAEVNEECWWECCGDVEAAAESPEPGAAQPPSAAAGHGRLNPMWAAGAASWRSLQTQASHQPPPAPGCACEAAEPMSPLAAEPQPRPRPLPRAQPQEVDARVRGCEGAQAQAELEGLAWEEDEPPLDLREDQPEEEPQPHPVTPPRPRLLLSAPHHRTASAPPSAPAASSPLAPAPAAEPPADLGLCGPGLCQPLRPAAVIDLWAAPYDASLFACGLSPDISPELEDEAARTMSLGAAGPATPVLTCRIYRRGSTCAVPSANSTDPAHQAASPLTAPLLRRGVTCAESAAAASSAALGPHGMLGCPWASYQQGGAA